MLTYTQKIKFLKQLTINTNYRFSISFVIAIWDSNNNNTLLNFVAGAPTMREQGGRPLQYSAKTPLLNSSLYLAT